MLGTRERVLFDGGRLRLSGHNVYRHHPDGRIVDLSWWPNWKVCQLLRQAAVGGLDGREELSLKDDLQHRRNPPFATITAPVNWQDLAWRLGEQDLGPKLQVHFSHGEQPCAVLKHDKHERLRVAASTRGATRGCRVALLDDDRFINGSLVRAIGALMRAGGSLEREPCPTGEVSLETADGAQLTLALLREPLKAAELLNHIGLVNQADRIACDVQWLASLVLQVRPEAQDLVIDF